MEETETTTTTTENVPATWADAAAASAANEEPSRPPRRLTMPLFCKLTDEEVRALGDSLEGALANVDTLTEEKKAAAAGFKARIELAKEAVGEIREALRSKKEEREVECLESFIYRLGIARITRLDTGEIVEDRALTGAERQPTLPGVTETSDDEDEDGEEEARATDLDAVTPAELSTPFDDEEDGPSIEDPQAVLDAEPGEQPAKRTRPREEGHVVTAAVSLRLVSANRAELQALEVVRVALRALDDHDRSAPAVSSVSAAQVRARRRVQLSHALTAAKAGLFSLLREDV